MRRTKRQTEFQIGDICTFTFNGVNKLPVAVVGHYDDTNDGVWVLPLDQAYIVSSRSYITRYFGDRTSFATSIEHLNLVERPCGTEDTDIDISTLI